MAINFENIGSFNGIDGGAKILNNPTSLQFGPDERLYVAELPSGTINAFTVELQGGEYVATANEELLLPNGAEVVKSIQNHNDDGSPNSESDRLVTGLVVTGTAANPVLYVSSSDPRQSKNQDSNLDTNSGVVTRVTWTGTEWSAVDIIRGLPRSEENHSVNGMVLSPDGTKLYLTVGGNTNNGAPSQFFTYTGEYALSGTILEIDLEDLDSRPILTDPLGGQNDASRQYIYDLPTLDDPTISNVTDGVGEDESGMDEAGPWGGNDGFNMAILPADAPLRIFADGFRNHYDLVFTESGEFYTLDNGSNNNLGGNPLDANGNPTNEPGAGEATNTPNDGGEGDPEPLFLLSDGGYYGHPNPARSNQNLSWTVYNDDGEPDTTLSINSVSDLSDLVPDGVDIADGFIIDPSKFTGNPARLTESGIRVKRDSPQSNTLVNLGSSSNGLVEYTGNAFDGALQGSLIVTQFNGNVTLLNLSDDGTSIVPLIDPTEGNSVADEDGIFPVATGLSSPLDVTIGPQGTIWVAELFGGINVFTPSQSIEPENLDIDEDGILNVNDPFIRDETNGGSVLLTPGQTLLWDFDANQDDNLPGPGGYGGGLTGVAIDNSTDFEEFFQEPSTLPDQVIKLDNVKFTTAAGGGTTVIESVSNGDPYETLNNGEYLFHTGVTVAPTVDTFTIKWSVFNPADAFTGPFQQIGGYIGTGDQSDYLKIVAVEGLNGEIQVLLEDNDIVQSESLIQANDLFNVPAGLQIFFELEVDPLAATATPTVTYEIDEDNTTTVSGTAIDLSGTSVLDAILGNSTVNGQTTGLAVGLLSSNNGQPEANTFQAIFNDIEITATGDSWTTVLYRVNAGGSQIAAIDGGIPWSADTQSSNSPFLANPGSNSTSAFSAVEPGQTVPETTPGAIFDSERWDQSGGSDMQWAFDVSEDGVYEVRLYMGNGFNGTEDAGTRIFDVAIENNVPDNLDNVDLSSQFGHLVGGVITNTVTVTDGTLNLDFIGDVNNPLINGIEILKGTTPTLDLTLEATTISENGGTTTATVTRNTDTTEALTVTLASSDTSEAIVPSTVEIPAGELEATFEISAVDDAVIDGTQTTTITAAADNFLTDGGVNLEVADDDFDPHGEATLKITAGSNNIQASNFGNNSFQITNTGDKKIAQVDINVANALYPDTVFDPFGLAGDMISKNLTINTNGNTGIVSPNNNSFVGAGGTAGFEAIELLFDENVNNGFETGETLGFSVDMDPNSIAGADKDPLDDGSNPPWDVGGVSGAELIGSTFTVTFTDGTTATGELQGAGNQGGSQTLASQSSPDSSVSLAVNGLEAGDVGTYSDAPNVIVNGAAGQTARVVLTKGFIQPVSLDPFVNGTPAQQDFAPTLQAQLDTLAASDFPANNAVEFQTVDVELTGENQNISELFDFSEVADFDFEGESELPLGFVASVIDPTNDDLPLGPVIEPIYLQFDESSDPPEIDPSEIILYRVNAGGSQIAAIDGGPNWSADTKSNNSRFLADPGSNSTSAFSAVEPGQTVPETTPGAIFDSERWDGSGGSEMQWAFEIPEAGLYEVRLYMGNGFNGTSNPGERVFDVAIEDTVLTNLDDIDLSDQFGHLVGGTIANTVEVTDGTLNIEFLHDVENPLVNGIEIIQLS